jgi:hypothetical protein
MLGLGGSIGLEQRMASSCVPDVLLSADFAARRVDAVGVYKVGRMIDHHPLNKYSQCARMEFWRSTGSSSSSLDGAFDRDWKLNTTSSTVAHCCVKENATTIAFNDKLGDRKTEA